MMSEHVKNECCYGLSKIYANYYLQYNLVGKSNLPFPAK